MRSPFSASSTVGGAGDTRVGDPGVPRELAVLPVYRHEVARPDQREHQLQLFLAAVPGDVDVLHALVDRPRRRAARCGSSPGRSPSRCPESPAPRTPPCRRGSSLTCRWSSMAMRDSAASGSPCEPVQMQTTSCAGIAADVAVADLHAGRDPQVAEPLRDLRVLDHAAADERHLADRTAPPGRRGSASGRCSTRTSRRRSCRVALVKISSKASMTSSSEPREALADRCWCCRRAAPARPRRRAAANRWKSKCSPSSGV